MLILSRSIGETLIIGDNIKITVLEFKGRQVKLGIEAPADVEIVREELLTDMHSGQFENSNT